MPWLVGLDEAGYGPNLGPLLQSAVAVRVPDTAWNLWERLGTVIRRAHEPNDHRLLIDDSKKVHEGKHGLRKLECGVLSLRMNCTANGTQRLDEFLKRVLIGTSWDDLNDEEWFEPSEQLPIRTDVAELSRHAGGLADATAQHNITLGPVFTILTPALRFNALLDEHRLKSVIPAEGVIAFCRIARQLPGCDALHFAVDKLGGRNFYSPLLQKAFPDGRVDTLHEGDAECRYRILGLEREIQMCFQPRADGEHMTVALASMVSKYLREVCMGQFNRWWAQRVPGIKATAGYPVDAARFMEAIRATMQELKIEESRVWRKK